MRPNYGAIVAILLLLNGLPTGASFVNTANAAEHLSAPQVTLDIQADRPDARPGESIFYRITVVNTGNATAHDVIIRDVVPQQLLYVVTSSNGGDMLDDSDPAGSGLAWYISSLEVQEPVYLGFEAIVR